MPDIIVTCPHCSGSNTIDSSLRTVHCKWCREDFLLETVDSHIFDDAIRKRNYLEFDEATSELENLLSSGNHSAELYFQLLLSDYGVSYVDVNDETSIRQIPTLNRLQNKSIFEKEEYKKLEKELSDDKEKLEIYRKKLEEIDKLRADSIKLMEKQDPFDIFICYKRTKRINDESYRTKDSETARRLYDKFSKWGLKVFFAEETLHHEFAGKAFEPIIYSALMSAKVFILVCASPKEPEMILSPWVKNEWQRYKKRIETESDSKLRLIPVFDNGFEPEQLPKQLYSKKMGNFEGLTLNDEFDKNILNVINQVISKEKRKKFQEIVVKTENVSINVATTNITLSEFKGYQLQNLDVSQEALFRMALSDMKANNKRSYAKAYKSLKEISDKNSHNYKANLAKVKCDFEIPYDNSLSDQSLFTLFENKNYEKFIGDYIDLISINDDNQKTIQDTFFNLLINTIKETFEKSCFSNFEKILSEDPNKNLFLILFQTYTYSDKEKKEKIDELSKAFLDSLKVYKYLPNENMPTYSFKKSYRKYMKDLSKYLKKEASNSKELAILIESFINRLFVPLYASLGERGSYELINVYYTIHQYLTEKYSDNKNLASLNDSLIDKILEIHPFYEKALFIKFFRTNKLSYYFSKDQNERISGITDNDSESAPFDEDDFSDLFSSKLRAKEGDSDYVFGSYEPAENILEHFKKIDIEDENAKPMYNNLYYVLAKTIKGGFEWKLKDDSSFSFTYRKILELIGDKQKKIKKESAKNVIKRIDEISKDFFEIVPSTKLRKDSHKKILTETGNQLLISGLFDEAQLFFEEVLTFDEHDVNILWELVKCEIKCVTNYDVILSKKNIHDTKAFRNLVETYISYYPDKINIHENFYSCAENVKNGKLREKNKYYRLFALKSKENIKNRNIDSVESIVNNFNLGQYSSESTNMKYDSNQDKYGVHVFFIPLIFASILSIVFYLAYFLLPDIEDWIVLSGGGLLALLIVLLFNKKSPVGRHQVLFYGEYKSRYKKSEIALLIYQVIMWIFTLTTIVAIWGLIPKLSARFDYIDIIYTYVDGLADSSDSVAYIITAKVFRMILTAFILFGLMASQAFTKKKNKDIMSLTSASLSFNILLYFTATTGFLFVVKTILRECSIDFLTSFVGGSAIGIFLSLLLAYLVAIHLIDSMVQKKIL